MGRMTTNPKDYQSVALQGSDPELDQGAKKTPFYKKKWFIASAAIVVLIGAVAGGGEDDAPVVSPSSSDSSIVVQSEVDTDISSSSGSSLEMELAMDDGVIKSGSYTLPSGMEIYFNDSVRNDVTGKWRISRTSDSLVPADYAAEYYETMFSSDDEIHAIWNATLNTTTRISVLGNLLLVDTMEHIDKEEHDANLLFSGMLLDSRIVNRETGEITKAMGIDIEGLGEEPPEESSASEAISDAASESGSVIPFQDEHSSAPEPTQSPEPSKEDSVSPPKSSGGSGNSNNFDTYDNQEQQNTSANYVLNTNTMKFHYPRCSSVAKIAPQNYEEFYGTRDDVIAMGYKSCGKCHP